MEHTFDHFLKVLEQYLPRHNAVEITCDLCGRVPENRTLYDIVSYIGVELFACEECAKERYPEKYTEQPMLLLGAP